MNRMIFVNLPVKDLAAARTFYTGLGFTVNEEFSDTDVACIVVSDTIFVMLLVEKRFRDFVNGEIADAHAVTEVLNTLTVDSPGGVDDLVAKALAHGGSPWRDRIVEGPMYGWSFADPDGHVWEVMHWDAS